VNLRQLEVLRAVMRTRSTIAAARELGMSQPAVSNAIKAIEAQLGFQLFDRQHRGLAPTDEAFILLEEAEPLFLIQEQINQTARHLKLGHKGKLRIVASAELSQSLMPSVLAGFSSTRPNVELSLETQRVDVLLDYLEAGICDIGFAFRPVPRHNLEYILLAEVDILCVCNNESPLVNKKFVTPNDLTNVPLINVRGMMSSLIEDTFIRSGANFRSALHVRFMNVAGHCAAAGLGATFMDELSAANIYDPLARIPFRPRMTIGAMAIINKEKKNQRLIEDFVKISQLEIKRKLSLLRKSGYDMSQNGT